MPIVLQNYFVNQYHTYLLIPVMDRTEASISQRKFWSKLRDDMRNQIKFYKTCQRSKEQGLKYVYLPAK